MRAVVGHIFPEVYYKPEARRWASSWRERHCQLSSRPNSKHVVHDTMQLVSMNVVSVNE